MNAPSVFLMGSGEIAVPSFERLVDFDAIEVVGIATQPDRPVGRKKVLTPTPVGRWAGERGLDTFKPLSVNSEEFLSVIRGLAPDILLVASFGQILKRDLLETPSIAPVNIHASILPRHRGASPIAAAILAGDGKTGVSFMRMDEGLDTGPVYRIFELEIGLMNAAELESALGDLAAERVEEMVLEVASGEAVPREQDHSAATLTKKIRKSDGAVDWISPADLLARMVRAYHPWPGAFFFIDTPKRRMRITITAAEPAEQRSGDVSAEPGVTLDADDAWIVACGDGALAIRRLIPEGGREMSAAEFLRGRPEVERGFRAGRFPKGD